MPKVLAGVLKPVEKQGESKFELQEQMRKE
jgi:hypothetical protein